MNWLKKIIQLEFFILIIFSLILFNILLNTKIKSFQENMDQSLTDYFITHFLNVSTINFSDKLMVYDTQSLRDLGHPLKRQVMADALVNIPANSNIVLDIIYGESSDIVGSTKLASALLKFPNVILPIVSSEKWLPEINILNKNSSLEKNSLVFYGNEALETSFPPVLTNKSTLSISDFELDTDGIFRWYPLVVKVNEGFLPSLAFSAYLLKTNSSFKILFHNKKISGLLIDSPQKNYFINLNLDPKGLGRIRLLPIENFNTDVLKPISLSDVLKNIKTRKESHHSNELVFIGATAAGVSLNQPNIKDANIAPIYNHLLAYEALMENLIPNTFPYSKVISVILGFILLLLGNVFSPKSPLKLLGFMLFSFILLFILNFMAYKFLIIFPLVPIISGVMGGLFCNLLKNYSSDQRKKTILKKSFSNYLHPELVKGITESDKEINLGGELTEIAILFSDLRNFTTLTESISPHELGEIMNEYFDLACREIQGQDGTIDKFIGDAVMAFWNAPLKTNLYTDKSVFSAINFIQNFNLLELKWREKFKFTVPIGIGIGLHQGSAIVGNFGSHNRFNYTAIGDTVNLSSRIESLCKYYGRQLIISEEVYKNLSSDFLLKNDFLKLETVRVKGKDTPITLYTWVPDLNDIERINWKKFQEYRELGPSTLEISFTVLKYLPTSLLMASTMLRHLEHYKTNIAWDGIWDFDHK
jgi:adenylate cyclase